MRMKKVGLMLLLVAGFSISAWCKSKGNCPPAPPISQVPPAGFQKEEKAPNAEAKTAGIVLLQAVISEKGYVCSLGVIQAFDPTAAKAAIDAVSRSKFDPARKSGHPVAVVAAIEIHFWRMPDGSLIQVVRENQDVKRNGTDYQQKR